MKWTNIKQSLPEPHQKCLLKIFCECEKCDGKTYYEVAQYEPEDNDDGFSWLDRDNEKFRLRSGEWLQISELEKNIQQGE